MGLEIQGAVNSMIGSIGSVIKQNEENKRKALNIALGAVTGGAGGAISAAAKEAGVNHQAVDQITGFQAQQDQKEDEQAVARTMNRRQLEAQAYANQVDEQLGNYHMQQEGQRQVRQEDKFRDYMKRLEGGR